MLKLSASVGSNLSLKTLHNLKKSLKNREEMLDFDLLGKSLAYNTYVPRATIDDFKRNTSVATKSAHYTILAGTDFFLPQQEEEFYAFVIDFTKFYADGLLDMETLDCLTRLRRYSEKFLIHADLFIKPYQLLESVVCGSDAVVLDAGVLKDNLASMSSFAERLGLVVIVKITSARELKTAIFARADAIYIAKNFSDLISLVPNNKVIFCDAPSNFDLNEKNSYGVDMFFIPQTA